MPTEEISKEELDDRRERLAILNEAASGQPEFSTPEASSTAAYAMMGEGYRIGNVELKPITMTSLNLLQAIDSPFLTDEDMDIEPSLELMLESLYVLAKGTVAIRPLIALDRRIAAAKKMEQLAESKVEYFEAYMKHIDRITDEAYAAFATAAVEFGIEIGPFVLADAVSTLELMFADALDGFGLLPTPSGEKKSDPLTESGSVD